MNIAVFTVLFSLTAVGVLGLTVEQSQLSWTKPLGKTVYINCKVTDLANDEYVHWYHQKDGEALKRILYVNKQATSTVHDPNYPEAKDFSVTLEKSDTYTLKLGAVKLNHAGVYYCACWVYDSSGYSYKVFGSGTRLVVTESGKSAKSAVKPTLSAYPVSRPSNGRSVLLCQARGMYPDLVRFIWKDQADKEVTVSDTVELLEQRDEGQEVRVTSMLIIDQQEAQSNTFTCYVQHDSSIDTTNNELKVTIPKEQETKPKTVPEEPVSTCKPETEEEENKKTNPDFGSFSLVPKLNLFNLTYVSLLVKNVLYFFAVCFLLYKRRDRSSKPDMEPNQGK